MPELIINKDLFEPTDRPDGTNVSNEELLEAKDPGIGAGNLASAPSLPAEAWNGLREKNQMSWKPTRKWFAAAATSVATIIGSWIVTGAFDDVERGMTATALAALVAAYFRENDPTPGGVPTKNGDL